MNKILQEIINLISRKTITNKQGKFNKDKTTLKEIYDSTNLRQDEIDLAIKKDQKSQIPKPILKIIGTNIGMNMPLQSELIPYVCFVICNEENKKIKSSKIREEVIKILNATREWSPYILNFKTAKSQKPNIWQLITNIVSSNKTKKAVKNIFVRTKENNQNFCYANKTTINEARKISLKLNNLIQLNTHNLIEKEITKQENPINNKQESFSENKPGDYKMAYIKTRKNHTIWAKNLKRHHKQCAVCGVKKTSLLIASHIKPWAKSNPQEQTDFNNGLVLCVLHDKLFELDYIAFSKDGYLECMTLIKQYEEFYFPKENKTKSLLSKEIKLPNTYNSEEINKYMQWKKINKTI